MTTCLLLLSQIDRCFSHLSCITLLLKFLFAPRFKWRASPFNLVISTPKCPSWLFLLVSSSLSFFLNSLPSSDPAFPNDPLDFVSDFWCSSLIFVTVLLFWGTWSPRVVVSTWLLVKLFGLCRLICPSPILWMLPIGTALIFLPGPDNVPSLFDMAIWVSYS